MRQRLQILYGRQHGDVHNVVQSEGRKLIGGGLENHIPDRWRSACRARRHWVGQGTGWFILPGNPMMNNHVEWTYAGLASPFGGIGLVTPFILGR
jgi:hypothetical protein